jgi:aspartyl protease family protein
VTFALCAGGALALRDRLLDAPMEAAAAGVASAPPATGGGRQAVLRKEADGHFWTTAYVNGTPVRFLVDTGATSVVLTSRDALRAGFDPSALVRNVTARTAAGEVLASRIELEEVRIDAVRVEEVEALVLGEGLEHSLLGMSFLNGVRSWEVTQRAIIVRQ